MKRGAPDNPKVAELARLLNINEAWCIGILELLWHFTARYAPQGDIGKHSDKAIAIAVKWGVRSGSRGVPTEVRLGSALVQAKFLDRCPCHRLVVHDWEDHCDEAVRKFLSRHGLDFVRHVSGLPLPEPVPLPEPYTTNLLGKETTVNGPATNAKASARPAPGLDLTATLSRLREIYQRAGVPIPPKHEQLAQQLILSLEPAARQRIPERLPQYCMWALASGRWRNAATTKTLVNVLRDGDWDVEIAMRDLPDAPSATRPLSLIEQKEQEYLRRHSKGAS